MKVGLGMPLGIKKYPYHTSLGPSNPVSKGKCTVFGAGAAKP